MTHRGQGNEQVTPADGQPWGQPWGSSGDDLHDPHDQSGAAYQDGQGGQEPYGQGEFGQDAYGPDAYGRDGYGQQGQYGQAGQPGRHAGPAQSGYQDQQGYGYGGQGSGYGEAGAQPLPAEAPAPGSADATQFLPPVPGAGGGDADPTQFIPAFPSQGQGPDAQATQFIAPVPAQDPHTPPPGAPAAYGNGPAPDPGEEGLRQPPAEFDSLFRTEGGGGGGGRIGSQTRPVGQVGQARPTGQTAQQGADSTQQLPQYGGYDAARQQPGLGGYDSPPPGGQDGRGRGGNPGRRKSPLILVAAVAAMAIVGLGVGALMSGGDDTAKDSEPVSASSPAPAGGGGAADPAKSQAESLDKLLADSNNSRESVIGAVGDIKSCNNLDGAASHLRDAAKQRRGLVGRLKDLAIDKLPDHGELASALTSGWQASASADDDYADWADQAKSHKVCRHGSARRTASEAQGDKASGEATTAKKKAAELWNGVASKYDLKQRSSSDL